MFEYNRNLLHIVDTEPTPPPHEYLAYFPFKTDMLDVTGNYTLTNHGGYIQGGVLVVDDVNSYLQLDSGIGVGERGYITINLRFYYDEENTNGNFLFGSPNQYGRGIAIRSNELGYWDEAFNNKWQSGGTILTTGNWYNIGVIQGTEDVYSSSPDVRIYLNGELAYHTPWSEPWGIIMEIIGNYQAGLNNGALGKISELIIDNVKRTDSEILSYYNRTKNSYPN